MKNEKGITLVAMAITILVMGILAGVTIYYTTPIIKNTKYVINTSKSKNNWRKCKI